MALFEVTPKLRTCTFRQMKWDDGENDTKIIEINGLFHCWIHKSEIIKPSGRKNDFVGGIATTTVGLIEVEDGTLKEVIPELIKFTDNEFSQYSFKNKN